MSAGESNAVETAASDETDLDSSVRRTADTDDAVCRTTR
jgi:hypothetical protein